ncbi:MAG: hypothetical protein ACSHWS_04860 [Sulfitobacter sp.]
MSDPVTNAEVEDVLSSIRRLVSEDKRPLHSQKTAPVNDRLVLTPALRVADAPQDDEQVVDAQEAVEDLGAETSSDQDQETIFDDPAHDYEDDPYNFADEQDEDGEGEVALDLSGLEVEQDNDDEHDHQNVTNDQVEDAETERSDANSAKAATLSAKIEALETAIGNISDTWEPDDPGADEYSGTEAPAMAWEDDIDRDALGAPLSDDEEQDKARDSKVAEPEAIDEPEVEEPEPMSEQTAQRDTPDVDSFAFASEDQLIDEEALRDLVSDIVRSELQGALGERITRNVRKLVRREIHRALAAQELE